MLYLFHKLYSLTVENNFGKIKVIKLILGSLKNEG